MSEEFLFMSGCPICQNSGPSVVTIMFHEPVECTYGHMDGLSKKQKEKFIEIHQSHRMAHIMSFKHILDE